jgi:hypothetical protein
MEKAKASGSNQHQERSPPATAPPKLADLGITETQSARWQKVAALPAEKFEEQLKVAKRKAVASVDSAQNQGLKRQLRAEREAALGASTAAAAKALGSMVYGVIYADPPWSFAPYSTETGMNRAADDHYPTMAIGAVTLAPCHAIVLAGELIAAALPRLR